MIRKTIHVGSHFKDNNAYLPRGIHKWRHLLGGGGSLNGVPKWHGSEGGVYQKGDITEQILNVFVFTRIKCIRNTIYIYEIDVDKNTFKK